jgi:uncharacterized protein
MNTFRSLRWMAVLAVSSLSLFGCAGGDDETAGTGDEQNVTQSAGTFETFQGEDGQFYFHLLAGNGEKVLQSEGYVSLSGAKKGIESVKTNAVKMERFELLEAVDGEWYFNLKAGNHQIIGTSETYVNEANAQRALETVNKLVVQALRIEAAETGGAHFETFRGLDKKYYFRLRAGNGEIVLQSQGYTTKASAEKGIASVRNNGKLTEQYEILEAQNGQHYFRLEAKNFQIIARSEMFGSLQNAERGVESVSDLLISEKVADPE